ncbi:MAG: phosphoglycolate phosphatase [Rhodospirillales bacterium]|nr:phosphoglycolate phosphatase [Rhodospirillales bacterium]
MTPHPALVFDLDGTLIDSVPQVAAAVNMTLTEAARPALSITAVRGIIGEGARTTLVRAFATTGGTDDIDIDAMVERYLIHYLADPSSHTTIFPGVTEVLRKFRALGTVMGICTNKPGATTRPVLDALNLSQYFAAVITADDTRHRKPDGRHVLATLAAMKADRNSAIFVGDSAPDLAAARDAGVPAIVVAYGYGYVDPATMPAAARIERFHELPAAVARIAARREATP